MLWIARHLHVIKKRVYRYFTGLQINPHLSVSQPLYHWPLCFTMKVKQIMSWITRKGISLSKVLFAKLTVNSSHLSKFQAMFFSVLIRFAFFLLCLMNLVFCVLFILSSVLYFNLQLQSPLLCLCLSVCVCLSFFFLYISYLACKFYHSFFFMRWG